MQSSKASFLKLHHFYMRQINLLRSEIWPNRIGTIIHYKSPENGTSNHEYNSIINILFWYPDLRKEPYNIQQVLGR